MRTSLLVALAGAAALASIPARAQHARPQQTVEPATRADSLRGSITPERAWWDVEFYDLHVKISPDDSSISGWNGMSYRVTGAAPKNRMQIDLQVPLAVDSMTQDGQSLHFVRDSNAFFAQLTAQQHTNDHKTIKIYYHGKPVAAKRPPWDGGFIWAHDSLGNRWTATANQGTGASVWWPNKDTQADEPDSQRIAITVPDPMIDVSNGRLRSATHNADHTTTYEWFVVSPINNYDVAVNAGNYTHYSDTLSGEAGKLSIDLYPLAQHESLARAQWVQVKPMLTCFEHWFGPYPWYADGYKMVEAPHLGMEHQSAIAYGNGFHNGYLNRGDLSHTGLGLAWDFIIVHESAHEWFGNNITTKDIADSWVHEGFANYAESIYEECLQGKEAGARYAVGNRAGIRNDAPIVAQYNLNREGSGDMYNKGGNMLHMIRQIVNDDEKWRSILRGLNKTFYHQTVTGEQVERYMSERAGIDLSKIFEQYLTTTKIPELDYRIANGSLAYRWSNVIPGFDMPVRVTVGNTATMLKPRATEQTMRLPSAGTSTLTVDENYYVTARALQR